MRERPRRRCCEYDAAVAGILRLLPASLARVLRWLLSPAARWVRIPAALLCFVFSAFWFLPVVGLEYLPIGLLLIARDIRPLRRPVGRLLLWLGRVLQRMRERWSQRTRFRLRHPDQEQSATARPRRARRSGLRLGWNQRTTRH